MTNIRVGDIGTTTSVVVPPTHSPSTKAPTTTAPVTTKASTTTKSPVTTTSAPSTTAPSTTAPSTGAIGAWGQCGGNNYAGPTTCVSGYKCNAYSEWYSQCIPN
ncbi:unnamed protein product [Aphanomyces euteiches]